RQRHKNRIVCGLTGKDLACGCKPLAQPLLFLGNIKSRIVRDVVRVAHKSIYSAESIALLRGQDKETVVEVLRGAAGHSSAHRIGMAELMMRHSTLPMAARATRRSLRDL